ncbi:SDR family NAD(P)-dependent oxidoreductase [Sporolactobacillus sp. CQH2019]|uniref:SDR family NAD(P)-dependent oxidoreductase n=1 Tax=Sporolactobacillus sp. CQH2019 TaxID=3023512 RepID=UPI002368B396|nr:SDR family oxidoreductase [Sporolactobacillus sp. CQH2019]MDD9150139.1 SDR family NAD(P)-dependent oxidoreductase [Sporolactobacillus sp. CQH2019]
MTKNIYPFDQKVVLITGGGSGMGRAIAQAFLDNHAAVAVTGRRPQALQETLAAFPGERTLAISKDISDPQAAAQIVAAVLERFGRLDVVVSNAGAFAGGDLMDLDQKHWEQLRSTNVDALFYLAQAAFPALQKTGGTLIATSSVSGLNGDWKQAAYNATKHAVNGFIRSLALDWGAKGVRVNAVAPAFTVTDMTASVAGSSEQLAQLINRIPLERPGYPADIAPAVLFLASPDAAYITGVVLPVDGGTSASTGQSHRV